jgi:methyl-accepting chemotaxis protein
MTTTTRRSTRALGTWFANRRLRTKIQIPVFLAVLGIVAVLVAGTLAVRSASTQTTGLYAHTTRPLADLAELRDAEGDARVAVRDLAASQPGATQDDVLAAVEEADKYADDSLAAYVADAGDTLNAGLADLVDKTRVALAAWRDVRDTQVLPAAQRGDTDAALRVVAGPLTQADDAFAAPLDKLFDSETASADAIATQVREAAGRDQWTMIIVGVLAALLAAAVALLVTRRITAPVRRMVSLLRRIGDGDLTHRAAVDSRDEIGDMATAMNAATESMSAALTTVTDTTTGLDAAARDLSAIGDQLSSSAEQSASQAGSASAVANEIASNIVTMAAGAEEMSASINEIARNADDAAKVATEAVALCDNVTDTIGRLEGSSTQIGNVVKMITSIAEQTNLLALNATIEAARAGDAGKGFAVVAGEVKDLAQETAKATENISRYVEAIQHDTGAAVSATGQIGTIIQQVSDYQNTIASAVSEQSTTTAQMGRNVSEVATGSESIGNQVSTVAGEAAATTAGVREARTATDRLSRLSADLRRAVDVFTI